MMKCGSVGPCVVGLVGQVGAGHLTHPSPHLPHFVLLGFKKRCWFGKNGTIWMNKRCKEGENGVGFGWKNKSGKIGSEEYVGREMVQKLGRWPRLVLVNRSTWCIPASSNPNFHLLRANKQPWNTFSASSHLYFSLSLNIFVFGGPSINTISRPFQCSFSLLIDTFTFTCYVPLFPQLLCPSICLFNFHSLRIHLSFVCQGINIFPFNAVTPLNTRKGFAVK